MTVSILNRNRRRRRAALKKAERRRQRHTGGEFRYGRNWTHIDAHPNRQRDTWHQSKAAR